MNYKEVVKLIVTNQEICYLGVETHSKNGTF